MSVHYKQRPGIDASALARRRRNHNPFEDADDDPEEEARRREIAPIEGFEASYHVWAFVRFYSVLHAGVAMKALNKTQLGLGKKLRAEYIQRKHTHLVAQMNTPQPLSSMVVGATGYSGPTTPVTPTTPATPSADPSASSGVARKPYFPLAYHRCLDVCNYFLGFNNWNCEIREIRRYRPAEDEELMDGQLTSEEQSSEYAPRSERIMHCAS
jgi:hypothetical protein